MDLLYQLSLLDKLFFAKHLHMLVRGGTTLSEALTIIEEQVKSSTLKDIIKKCNQQIKSGKTLNSALFYFEKQFGLFFIKSIQLGEEKGSLEQNLSYLVNQLQREYDFKNKIKEAAFYPSLILGTFCILGAAIYFYILPNLTKLFQSTKKELPITTKFLIALGNSAPLWGPIIIATCIITLVSLPFLLRLPWFKLLFDRSLLRFPILGKIVEYITLARCTQSLGTMLHSGVYLPEALTICADSTTNQAYTVVLHQIAQSVNNGQALTKIFERETTFIFPIMVRKMISLGESSGSLPDTLTYLAEFYENEANRMMHNITSMLEPILLIVIGGAIAFIAFAIITPMYDLTNVLSETPK